MEEESRIVSGMKMNEDVTADVTLRPQSLGEYIGQDKVKEKMAVFIEAAKKRGEALDHVLLYGPPGHCHRVGCVRKRIVPLAHAFLAFSIADGIRIIFP